MSKSSSVGVSFVVWLLALAAACTWVWTRSHTPKAVARELLRMHLLDPNSARFDAMRHYPTTNAVCGDIQRRDPNGRYARAGSFIVLAGSEVVLERSVGPLMDKPGDHLQLLDEPTSFARMAAAQCSNS